MKKLNFKIALLYLWLLLGVYPPQGSVPNAQPSFSKVILISSGSPYSVSISDEVIIVTTGASGFTVNLPPASSNAGREIIVIKGDGGIGAVTVAAAGGDTIQGGASDALNTQYAKVYLMSDGVNTWYDLTSGGV